MSGAEEGCGGEIHIALKHYEVWMRRELRGGVVCRVCPGQPPGVLYREGGGMEAWLGQLMIEEGRMAAHMAAMLDSRTKKREGDARLYIYVCVSSVYVSSVFVCMYCSASLCGQQMYINIRKLLY